MKKPTTIDEMHEVGVDLFKKLINICEKEKIEYYMAYGTLIGTVRHNGFIPWDDDIDIMFLRPHYERFVKYCITHENELLPYKVLSTENDVDYPYPIARFIDTRYEAVFDNVKLNNCGAFIDLYPFDYLGQAREEDINKLRIEKRILKTGLQYCIMKKI